MREHRPAHVSILVYAVGRILSSLPRRKALDLKVGMELYYGNVWDGTHGDLGHSVFDQVATFPIQLKPSLWKVLWPTVHAAGGDDIQAEGLVSCNAAYTKHQKLRCRIFKIFKPVWDSLWQDSRWDCMGVVCSGSATYHRLLNQSLSVWTLPGHSSS